MGIALALDAGTAVYVPLDADADADPDCAALMAELVPHLAGPGDARWIARDAKRAQLVFGECGHEIGVPHFDVGKDVRVSSHELIDDGGHDVVVPEAVLLQERLKSRAGFTDHFDQ